ncbi:UNVERIFIED_CONTAM: hypothetical protein RMT77_014937 [Armadillidium vulgare]
MSKTQIHSTWKLERRMVVVTLVLLSCLILSSAAIVKYPPRMVKQPLPNKELLFQVARGGGEAENEKPFTIECEAQGSPPPKYTWYKDGQPYNVDGTLVIKSPKESDSGQYQCFATNELGVATSNSVFVRKYEFNSFKDEDPQTIIADEGQPASLTCQPPQSYPKPTVFWIKEYLKGAIHNISSERVTVDPEGTLWFSNITKDDKSHDFTYTCATMSTFRNEYKLGSRVFLKVNQLDNSVTEVKNEPKKQFVSRKNTIILKGRNLQLWCIFSGTPLPQIKWMKKNGVLPLDRVVYENYGKRLVIKNADFDDEGTYECEAENGIGTTQSYTMNVEVQAIPYFTVEPEIQNKTEEETAIFKCEAFGKPKPKMIWTYNGHPIGEKDNMVITANMITIYNLSMLDTGNFGCNATNENGYIYKDVYLNVQGFPPEIEVAPTDLQTVDGRDVKMTCRAFGIPEPRITWVKNGNILTGDRYNISEDGDLLIKEVNFKDSGIYTCHAVNKFGNQTRSSSLEVKRRTKITVSSMDYEVTAGDTATFRCNVLSDPSLKLSIDWMVDNKTIDFDEEPRITKQSDNSLRIINTTICDSGLYTCFASTELDEAKISATLIVRGFKDYLYIINGTSEGSTPPGKPSFSWSLIRNLGYPAINISLIPDEANPGAFFFVQYRRYGESSFMDSRLELNEDFLILDDVDVNETYEVRLVAVKGHYCTTSDIEEIGTSDGVATYFEAFLLSEVIGRSSESPTTIYWLIGITVTILFFLLILLIVCVIKRKRSGSYTLHESQTVLDKEDLYIGNGFTEFSRYVGSGKRESLRSDVKNLIESDDADSVAEIGKRDLVGRKDDGRVSSKGQNDFKKEEFPSNRIIFLV